jgi:hypothetical protein
LEITARALHDFAADLAAALGVGGALRPAGVRVSCALVPAQRGAEAEPGFLNSYITEDLGRIETALGKGDHGPALRDYLADADGLPVHERIDVRANRAASTLTLPARNNLLREQRTCSTFRERQFRPAVLGSDHWVGTAGTARCRHRHEPSGGNSSLSGGRSVGDCAGHSARIGQGDHHQC